MVGLAVGATGLTNLAPGGTAPASGWLVGQYRRRRIAMPLALWAVLAGGYAATVSILLLLLVGAGIAGLLAPWAAVGCGAVLGAGAVLVVVAAHRLDRLSAWTERHHAGAPGRLLHRIAGHAATTMGFRARLAGGSQVLGLSLANWALDVFVLIAAFGLLDLPIPWHAVLFAYATAQVAGSLAPVPGGIGFVEGGMIGAFALAGSGVADAVAATVIYRAITCWLMAAIGTGTLVVVSRRAAPPAELDPAASAQPDTTTCGP
jgi:putative heme transporter